MRLRTVGLLAIFVLGLFGAPLPVEAQQPEKIYRIGIVNWLYFVPGHSASIWPIAAFGQAMREHGYRLGQNVVFEVRSVKGTAPRGAEKVAELVRLNVGVIVPSPAPFLIRAAQQATRTIPIVMPGVTVDPVEAGFVQSLARPGGNITGTTNLEADLHPKRLELLKQTFPQISSVAILWPGPQKKRQMKEIEAAARALGIQLYSIVRTGPLDQHLESALATISRERPAALLLTDNELAIQGEAKILEYATKKQIPTMYARSRFVESGGLMSYGADLLHLYRRSARFVDKILRGAKPGDLPVERPTKFKLVINLKTAGEMGLKIPPGVLFQADQVIR